MSSGRYQLLVKGTEDLYLTGTPQITYFRSVYAKLAPFLIRYNENPFYSYGSAYGGSQFCKINTSGDIARNNFLKITLPSLFIPTYGWCFPTASTGFSPSIYLLNESFIAVRQLDSKNTVVYYNTVVQSWLPPTVTYSSSTNKFLFSFTSKYIGFKTLDEALFWGFKNYIFYRNGFYVFDNLPTSELSLLNSGWINSYTKYFRSYIDSVGSKIVEKVEFYIGGQLIENIPGEFLIIYKDLCVPEQLQESLNKLEGWTSSPSTSDLVYYVWIPISLTNIPLCSIYRQDVEFKVFFKKFTDLIDPKYQNIDTQFATTMTLPFTANAVIYNGDTPYFINETGIFSKNSNISLTESITPNASLLAGSNIFMLGESNLLMYNTISNVETKHSFINSHTIKQSVGIVFAVNLFNFTGNGIVQKIVASTIYEYKLNLSITSVKYYNGFIYIFNGSTVYVYTLDLTFVQTYTFESNVLFSISSTTVIYFVTSGTVYQYDSANFTIFKVLPTTSTIVDVIYANGQLYVCYQTYLYEVGTGSRKIEFPLVVTTIQNNGTAVYITYRDTPGIYSFDIRQFQTPTLVPGLTATYIKGFIPTNNPIGIWISSDNIIGTIQFSSPPIYNEQYINISPNVLFAYDGVSSVYLADGSNIYNLVVATTICKLQRYITLPNMQSRTMAYDGQKIYIIPSNGTSNIIIYDTTSYLKRNESYNTIRLIDTISGSDKKLYVNSSWYDGKNVYMSPNALDGNIVTYNTLSGLYTITDFVKTTSVTKKYTPQNITASIVLGTDMFMFYNKGFYRYDTSVPGSSLYSNAISTSNVIASVYDKINSNIYFFSSNLAADGLLYASTSTALPNVYSTRIYNDTIGNVYSSMTTYGSYLYMVPKIGTAILKISKTNPYDRTNIIYSPVTNSSNTSAIIGSNLFCFPGPSSTNVIVVDTKTNATSTLKIQPGDYRTACYYDYGYVFTSNTITRVNTKGDQFIDFSGYSNISANTLIKPTNYTASNAANVFFVSSNIIRYDTLANTYNVFINYNLIGNIVGVSEYTNSNIYIFTSTGNVMFTNLLTIPTNTIATPVDICANSQYIFTMYKSPNLIGRLDLTGDINGTGYYTSIGNKSNCTGNVISFFSNGTNLYTVYDNSNLAIFSLLTNSFSNIQLNSKNSYPNYSVFNSNIYLLPQNGNVMVELPSLTQLTLPISNISGATAGPTYMYLTSNTNNTIVEYTRSSSKNYSLVSNNSSCYYLDSNVFFFPYDSNVVSVYDTRKINFENKSDTFNKSNMNFSNVVSTYGTYCLTDDYKLFSINQNNPAYSVPIYLRSSMAKTNPITIPNSSVVVTKFILFDAVGVWTFKFQDSTSSIRIDNIDYKQSNPLYIASSVGFKTAYILKTADILVTKPNDTSKQYSDIFYDTDDNTTPLLTITTAGMVVSNNATKMYSISLNYTYTFNPSPSTYNFSNAYSTPSCTYIYNNVGSVVDSLIVYRNYTVYTEPVVRFNTNFNSINSIIHQGQPGSTVIYMITNSSNLVRFDELYDSLPKNLPVQSNFTQIQNVVVTPGSQLFKMADGVGMITSSKVYGIGVQALWTTSIAPETPLSNPIFIGSKLYMFSSSNIFFGSVSQISDLQDVALNNATSFSQYSSFKSAFYDTNKYLVISTNGNLLAYNTTIALTTPLVQSINWNQGPASLLLGSNTFIPSSNTNDLSILYSLSIPSAYSTFSYNIPSVLPNSVKYLSNTAYMLGPRNIVSFNMKNQTFAYTPTVSNIYLFEQGYVIYKSNVNGQFNFQNQSLNIYSTSYDGRYINIVTGSNVAQFDTISNNFSYQPISANATVQVGSNAYFYTSNSNVRTYSSANRSYITVPIPEACNGLSLYGSNIFFASNTRIYTMNSTSLSNSVIYSNTLTNVGKTTRFGNQMAFTFNSNVVIINGDTLSNVQISVPPFTNVIFDSYDNFYLTGNSFTRFSNGTITSTSISNTFPYPNYSFTGAGFVSSGSLFALSNSSEFIKYTPSSNIFYTLPLPLTTNSITNYVLASNVYLPPGSNTNVMQIYDMSKPFFWSNAYSNIRIETTNVTSYVTTKDNVYYVSNTSGNLISYSGARSAYYSPNAVTASFDGDSIFFANSTAVSKLLFTPVVPPSAFKNNISFTQQTNISSLLLNGGSLYTIGDYIYNIDYNNLQLADTTQIFQPSEKNVFINSKFNSAYFDGRFLSFVTNSVKVYDTLTLQYPEILSPSIITEYVYLQDDERAKFINSDLKYIITQLQKVKITSNGRYNIDFLNLLTEVIFEGDVKRVSMYLNGHERFSCDADYMKNIQPYLYHTRQATRSNIFMYSFCTNPEEELPEGYLNASRIKDKVFDFEINSDVTVYGVTKNILTVRDGLGGLVFNNSTD
jgi:hypothetical protein